MTEQANFTMPPIPMGQILQKFKQYRKDMKDIGLGGAEIHPIQIFMIATRPDLENPYAERQFFDVEKATKRKRLLVKQHGQGAAKVFRVNIALNKDK